jgi:methionine synthase / methylenetetrahydrofolate reductase(NADPH)
MATSLFAREVVVTDGGMGTSLVERGASPSACLEALTIDQPDLVAEIHAGFAAAGATMLWTNTFGASRHKLARFGREHQVEQLNTAAVRLARPHAGTVVGSVGPLGVHLAPYGRVSASDAQDAFAQQVDALAQAGADLIGIETQSDLAEVEQAVRAVRRVGALPCLVSLTFTADDRTLLGATPRQAAQRLVELGVDAAGINCSQGPHQARRLAAEMVPVLGDIPLVVRPNAGGPQQVGGRLLYPATARYFGHQARALVDAGVAGVGGCCGTGPAHIRAVKDELAAPTARHAPDDQPEPATTVVAVPAPRPSGLASKLDEAPMVIAVEMDPPRSSSTAVMLAAAETLKEAGADAVTVADSPMARMRMSPWAACRLIQEHTGMDAVLHFPTRGRNILRIQGDLLAAHALGIRNVFVCMGDPAEIGDYPQAMSSADIVPTGLIALLAKAFNRGTDQAGASIGEATAFTIGCALSPAAPDLQRECRLLHRKIEAGAHFALTQPIYSPQVLERFRDTYTAEYGPLTLPLLVGVLPLVSARHADFLHHEVPGIRIPEGTRSRLSAVGADARREGVRIASELVAELRGEAALYLMPPFGRFDLAAELIDEVRGG